MSKLSLDDLLASAHIHIEAPESLAWGDDGLHMIPDDAWKLVSALLEALQKQT